MASTSGPTLPSTSSAPPFIHSNLQYILDWNPQPLTIRRATRGGTTDTRTQPASFYDKHLKGDLILKHLQYHPDLTREIAQIVDDAITSAQASGHPLPAADHLALPGLIEDMESAEGVEMARELPVAERYKTITVALCVRIASTLALHPRTPQYLSLLKWTLSPASAVVSIADGALQLSFDKHSNAEAKRKVTLYPYMDSKMLRTLRKVHKTFPDLAIWEFKGLTVGPDYVMTAILSMSKQGRRFPWVFCTCDGTDHKRDFNLAVKTKRGPDADETPWTVPSIELDQTQPDSVYDPIESQSSQELFRTFPDRVAFPKTPEHPTAALTRIEEVPHEDAVPTAATEDTVRNGGTDDGKKTHDPKDLCEAVAEISAKIGTAASSSDPTSASGSAASNVGKRKMPDWHREKEEVTGDSFIQQAWSQAVRTDSTLIVLHSGNHEFVGIRHRESQTLYISDLIHPATCKNPAYGKLHVGIYMAAVNDAVRRWQTITSDDTGPKPSLPPKDSRGVDGGGGDDGCSGGRGGGEDGHRDSSIDGDGEPDNKRPRSSLQDKRQGQWSSGATLTNHRTRRTTRTMEKNRKQQIQRTMQQAYSRNVFLLYLCYGIYDSPNPASFFRSAEVFTNAGGLHTPPSTPLLQRKYPRSDTVTIMIYSELGEGSTGKVHGGLLTVDTGTDCIEIPVAVKLSFSTAQKDRLHREARIYETLVDAGVPGIPAPFGLFTDPECHSLALVLTHGGQSIYGLKREDIDLQKRSAFRATLKAIHQAGYLHGDIRSPNLLVDDIGNTTIIDFDQATQSEDEPAMASELHDLSRILDGET